MLHVFVDADACPVKDEVYRVARRYGLGVTLVANSWMGAPKESWIALEVVGGGSDAADHWIALRVQSLDIVITADIPLASRCVKIGARVIAPTGKLFTEDNIGQALATRDLMTDLRDAGHVTRGAKPMSARDRSNFLQRLDGEIQRIRRAHPAPPDKA